MTNVSQVKVPANEGRETIHAPAVNAKPAALTTIALLPAQTVAPHPQPRPGPDGQCDDAAASSAVGATVDRDNSRFDRLSSCSSSTRGASTASRAAWPCAAPWARASPVMPRPSASASRHKKRSRSKSIRGAIAWSGKIRAGSLRLQFAPVNQPRVHIHEVHDRPITFDASCPFPVPADLLRLWHKSKVRSLTWTKRRCASSRRRALPETFPRTRSC